MVSPGKPSNCIDDVLNITTEAAIASYYLGINHIPTVIKSPLRKDNKPSFGIYSNDGIKVKYFDFASREHGGIFDLLINMWKLPLNEVCARICNDFLKFKKDVSISSTTHTNYSIIKHSNIELKCKVRNWRNYDIEYWKSFGISLKWLKYANVYPISHKIIIKGDNRMVFGADKYAYAYVEYKEGKITLKIYQPFNKKGFKWSNNHDKSVISLWTKVPEYGDRICICSSLKDSLCLWANTGIPALAIQGEGYGISNTAINELKRRFKKVYILLDNDEVGLKDGISLSKSTGFINIVLPKEYGEKDISDLYKSINNKNKFKQIILPLFKEN